MKKNLYCQNTSDATRFVITLSRPFNLFMHVCTIRSHCYSKYKSNDKDILIPDNFPQIYISISITIWDDVREINRNFHANIRETKHPCTQSLIWIRALISNCICFTWAVISHICRFCYIIPLRHVIQRWCLLTLVGPRYRVPWLTFRSRSVGSLISIWELPIENIIQHFFIYTIPKSIFHVFFNKWFKTHFLKWTNYLNLFFWLFWQRTQS